MLFVFLTIAKSKTRRYLNAGLEDICVFSLASIYMNKDGTYQALSSIQFVKMLNIQFCCMTNLLQFVFSQSVARKGA